MAVVGYSLVDTEADRQDCIGAVRLRELEFT